MTGHSERILDESGSTKPGPSEDYKALLRGEISSAEYVHRMKANVDGRLERRPKYVYASSRKEAQALLDKSYLRKYLAVPIPWRRGG